MIFCAESGRRLAMLLLAATLAGAPCVQASTRLALLPIENLAGSEEASSVVGPALAAALEARGWQPVTGEPVERILREERARRGDTIPDRARERLLTELDAEGVAVATVLVWRPGRNASVALSARILGTGGTKAAVVSALSASELERAFALGPPMPVEAVAARVVEVLAEALPAPGQEPAASARRRAPAGGRAPVVLRDGAVFSDVPLRIGLLPFANDARERTAPRVLTEVLHSQLRASGAFEVVEPAELFAALRAARIPSLRFLDAEALRAVAEELGVRHFLRGTVWRWVEDSASSSRTVPEVELQLELVDVKTGRVVWAAQHERRGGDYVGLFLRGGIGTATGLLDQVVAEILSETKRSKPVRLVEGRSEVTP